MSIRMNNITRFDDTLFMITLPVPITGFSNFISSWVWTGGPVVIVDVGPSSTSEHLLAALAEIGVGRPDYILLTHVHIDHSGAIGQVSAAFPETPVVCHPKAAPHVQDPQRLWEGSLKTLGDVALRYGAISPVDSGRVLPVDRFAAPGITAIPTPGHAVHHFSYLMGDLLFAGEAGGVCLALGGNDFYMRPATPPRFIMEIYLESIDRLIACRPRRICYGHVGMREDAEAMLVRHRTQLSAWLAQISLWRDSRPHQAEDDLDGCLEDLLANDPLLAGFGHLGADVQERERFFLRNSIKGYWEYLSRYPR